MLKVSNVLLALGLLVLSVAEADDTAFGGQGAVPMPVSLANAAIKVEHIIIQGHRIDTDKLDGDWHYSCDYTFKNNSDKKVLLKMGFPFAIRSDKNNVSVPKGRQLRDNDPMVYDFRVAVNHKRVKIARYDVASNASESVGYSGAYLWNMALNPRASGQVHHEYVTGVTTDVMGQVWVTYVLRTGSLWHAKKPSATKIEIIPNTPTRLCDELDTQNKPSTVQGMQIVGEKGQRKYLWEVNKALSPTDINICLQTGRNYIRYHVVYPIAEGSDSVQLDRMSMQQLQFLQHAIYAQYGQRFNDPAVQNYFNQQWWYEANPHYSNRLLTPEDKKALAFIRRYLKSGVRHL